MRRCADSTVVNPVVHPGGDQGCRDAVKMITSAPNMIMKAFGQAGPVPSLVVAAA